jgi:hypothetical protein
MKAFMNKEDQIGKVTRYGKFRLERVARTFIGGENTDFLNQVLLTHRKKGGDGGGGGRAGWVGVGLGKEFGEWIERVGYIEGLFVEG